MVIINGRQSMSVDSDKHRVYTVGSGLSRRVNCDPERDYQYTYTRYRQLLDELTDVGLSFTTYGGNVSEGEVLLRHDVDLSVERAVRMAEIEASANVDSTYYFYSRVVYTTSSTTRRGTESTVSSRLDTILGSTLAHISTITMLQVTNNS